MMAKLDILNGFAGKVISDCIDISINAIKKADKNQKSENQTIDARIYQVTIDALNECTYNRYKKGEKAYDAAESILKELKRGNGDYQEAAKSGLKMLVGDVDNDICQDFLETLCHEICKDENDVLYKEIALIQQKQLNKNMNEGFKDNNQNHRRTHEKLDKIQEGINGLKERQDIARDYETENANKIPIKNRAAEYADKWSNNVFLNDFNVEDENAGVNIQLQEIYKEECLPRYIWGSNSYPSDKLMNLLKKYIIDNNERKMLLVLGQPGIGKSTLITWIMANLVENKNGIFVYQFATDLRNIRWEEDNVLNNMFKAINLSRDEAENKVLILDGFDEINASNDRGKILNKLYYGLKGMNYVERFSLIITCRENYIDRLDMLKCDYITLQAWNDEQISSFCKTYSTAAKCNIAESTICKMLENREIFGIPLILYMVLVLNIDIEKSSSIVDVYNQIFSVDSGGIYDRCIKNLNYALPHRIGKIKQQVHQISQRIAFWIFENNPEKAFIYQKDFKNICDTLMNDTEQRDIQSDVLIGNYFKLVKHCEGIGGDELQFVHRSIYEYFVVIYFFESIYNLTSKKEIAGKLGELLKDGCLSEQILKFVECKFNDIKKCNLADATKEIFNIMLRDGMTYHIGTPVLNVIDREMNIFSNMLEVVGLWNCKLEKLDDKIGSYLQYNHFLGLNLRGVNLGGTDLRRANLRRANLIGANLRGADLRGGDLREADLRGVDLREADLRGADLREADLRGADLMQADLKKVDLSSANLMGINVRKTYLCSANLRSADLRGVDLREADLRGANLNEVDLAKTDLKETIFDEKHVDMLHMKYDLSRSKVFLHETNKVVDYKEYCFGKVEKD